MNTKYIKSVLVMMNWKIIHNHFENPAQYKKNGHIISIFINTIMLNTYELPAHWSNKRIIKFITKECDNG